MKTPRAIIKIFTELSREEIEALEAEQAADPGKRPLQHRLAKGTDHHGSLRPGLMRQQSRPARFSSANKAVDILHKIDEPTLLAVMEWSAALHSQPRAAQRRRRVKLIDLSTEHAPVFSSKGEMRKLVQGGGVSLNNEKVAESEPRSDRSRLFSTTKYLLAPARARRTPTTSDRRITRASVSPFTPDPWHPSRRGLFFLSLSFVNLSHKDYYKNNVSAHS